jgi:hypothetical protein
MKENNTWRIRYNNELRVYKQFEEPSISDIIKLNRLQWAGLIQCTDEKRILKRILDSNIVGNRPVEKPRKRWVNAVEIDIREILKVRNWRRESLDKQVRRRHSKEGKGSTSGSGAIVVVVVVVVVVVEEEEEEEEAAEEEEEEKLNATAA